MRAARNWSKSIRVYLGLTADPSEPSEPFAWTARTMSLFALQTVVVALIFLLLTGGSLLRALGFGAVFVVSILTLTALRSRRDRR